MKSTLVTILFLLLLLSITHAEWRKYYTEDGNKGPKYVRSLVRQKPLGIPEEEEETDDCLDEIS